MSIKIYGRAFSREVIDSEPVVKLPKELIPWLQNDMREAIEGTFVKDHKGNPEHDGQGLDKAEKYLKTTQALLKSEADEKNIAFIKVQLANAQNKVEFYRGKIYLLDKLIANAI